MPSPDDRPARGVRGFLLNRDNDGSFVFRVYAPPDAGGRRAYVDYVFCFDDLEVEVVDPRAWLVASGGRPRLAAPL